MLPFTSILARLLWAALLGAVFGVERDLHKRPAGIRTSLCISIGAALFTIISVEIARRTGDTSTTRIASNVVQGVGFLGAGAILRERGGVTGMTTAAAIFAVAAIGMAAGGGLFAVSAAACALIVISLIGFYYLENVLNLKPRYMLFRISAPDLGDIVPEVHKVFRDLGIALDNFQASMIPPKNMIQFEADVSHRQQQAIFVAFTKPGISCEMLPAERIAG